MTVIGAAELRRDAESRSTARSRPDARVPSGAPQAEKASSEAATSDGRESGGSIVKSNRSLLVAPPAATVSILPAA
jgi:hypothetical protein